MKIEFQPLGIRFEPEKPGTLLDTALRAGVEMSALCGGGGTCGRCKIRLTVGSLSAVTDNEKLLLSKEELENGFRFACQCYPITDCMIDIPPESFTTIQRIQVEGKDTGTILDPVVNKIPISIEPPKLSDTIADDKRLFNALKATGVKEQPLINRIVLKTLSTQLRNENWTGSIIINNSKQPEISAFLPKNTMMLGLAGDLGSTKLALYLIDLVSGTTLAKSGTMNPQISFGEDVVNRIAYAMKHHDGRETLQNRLVQTINETVLDLCKETSTSPDWIVDVVMVGNTAMHHFFAGLPIEQLGQSPYLASVGQAIRFHAGLIGLNCMPGASVYMPPNLAGFVGADHIATLLSADSWHGDETILTMDIGTNTEISLLNQGRLSSCSCASGPAFEGAHIRHGMRAAPGAIERVQIQNGNIAYSTIGGEPPVGICGSGILEVVSEMMMAGIIDNRGAFSKTSGMVDWSTGKGQFILVSTQNSENEKEIVITRNDINQIQLAKSAIRAGVEILLSNAGISSSAIDRFLIAGAFGTYLDVQHSIKIGMFPDIPITRFSQIGNAAGVGACKLLLSKEERQKADEIASRMNYVELTTHPNFLETYIHHMYLGKE